MDLEIPESQRVAGVQFLAVANEDPDPNRRELTLDQYCRMLVPDDCVRIALTRMQILLDKSAGPGHTFARFFKRSDGKVEMELDGSASIQADVDAATTAATLEQFIKDCRGTRQLV